MIAGSFLKFAAVLVAVATVCAVDIDVKDEASIKDAAQSIAEGLTRQYPHSFPGAVPGILPEPHYWIESGLMFNTLVEYAHYTGDSQFNPITIEAMQFQRGNEDNFMPANQTRDTGNDDQGSWALAAMTAAERNMDHGDGPAWIDLARNAFESLVVRWDEKTCGGGLRWQIFLINAGFDYKNAMSTGVFFSLGSRLARFTNNTEYADWAERAWDWMEQIGLLDSKTYYIYDGLSVDTELCSDINGIQWSMNAGLFLQGAAYMYNHTNSDEWRDRVEKLITGLDVFFPENSIMNERACEPYETCDADQKAYKSGLARGMGSAIQLAPFTQDRLLPWLEASAEAAASHCSDGEDQRCSFEWPLESLNVGDEESISAHINALSVVQNLLSVRSSPPGTAESPSETDEEEDDSPGDNDPENGGPDSTSTDPADPAPTGAGTAASPAFYLALAMSGVATVCAFFAV